MREAHSASRQFRVPADAVGMTVAAAWANLRRSSGQQVTDAD
jgi:hypothetical protein